MAGAIKMLVKEMWADPNLKDFQVRLRRIQKAHAKGYGFEARGTLGRSATLRRGNPLPRLAARLTVIVALAFVGKAALFYHVGAETYDARVAGLAKGEGMDPLAARLMQADPLTRALAGLAAQVFPANP